MNFARLTKPLIFTTIVTFAGSARADDEAAAAQAMQRGIAAYGQGDVQAALAAYNEAEKLAPRANVPFLYAAEALVRLERYPEAVASLEHYLEINPNVSDASEVRDRILALRRDHFPGELKIETAPLGAHLTIDGVLRAEITPATLKLPAGNHAIVVSKEGYERSTSSVLLKGDAHVDTNITLIPRPPPPLPPPAPPPPPAGLDTGRTLGWVGVGVGGAVLGTATVLDWTALKQKTDSFDTAKAQGSQSAIGLQRDVQSLRTGVVATYIAGGVIAAGGVALVLFAPHSTTKTGAAPSLRLESRVAPGRGEFTLAGSF